jgi:hypothetical protein
MESGFLIKEISKNKDIFESIFNAFEDADEFIRWKPSPDKWCLLEILCHLIDEEKEDFRMRVRFALANSEGQPPAIDPQGWVTKRNYAVQNFSEKRVEFFSERSESIRWLNSLKNEDWNAYFTHSKFGKFTAHYMLTNWLAHDLLHIKQITRLRYDYLASKTGENLNYAGEWK